MAVFLFALVKVDLRVLQYSVIEVEYFAYKVIHRNTFRTMELITAYLLRFTNNAKHPSRPRPGLLEELRQLNK